MNHAHIIGTIADALRRAPTVRALFLGGSHGNGLADQYSDIDFVLVSTEGASDAVAELWRQAVGQTGDIVLWWDRSVRPALINAVTEDWTRTDVVILKPDQMGSQTQSALKPLFDHDGLFEQMPEVAQQGGPSPARLTYQFEEFIRILGLLHLGYGPGRTPQRCSGHLSSSQPAGRSVDRRDKRAPSGRRSASQPPYHRRAEGTPPFSAAAGARARRVDRRKPGLCKSLSAACAENGASKGY